MITPRKRLGSIARPVSFLLKIVLSALICVVVLPAIGQSSVPSTAPTTVPSARPTVEKSGNPATLEQQAKGLYDAGQFTEAVTILQQALQIYRDQGDRIGQAIVLSNLSLSYQQLGSWESATQSLEEALTLLKASPNQPERLTVQAQVLDVQGSLFLARGKADQAISAWEQAAGLYGKAGETTRSALSQINQAQALQTLGMFRRAIATLEKLQSSLQAQPDSITKATALRSLGDALRLAGDLDKAEKALQQSLTMAQRQQSSSAIAASQLSLGNLARAKATLENDRGNQDVAQAQIRAALDFYQQAARATDGLTRAQSLLNRLHVLTETPVALLPGIDLDTEAIALYPQLQQQVASLPPGRSAVEIQIGLGKILMKLQKQPSSGLQPLEIAQVFATAVQQAQTLNDPRTLSYALGSLAGLYEQAQQWSDAQTLTQQALILAQSVNATDIAYRWQWQLGRILQAQGQPQDAIATYMEAFNSLQAIRRDLVAVNSDVQFTFRESVEPVYRQLVDLLLQSNGTAKPSQSNLQRAREVLEALQVAQLENFLQAACQDNNLQIDRVIDQEAPTTAVIYPIILEKRLEVILKLPGKGDLQHYSTPISRETVTTTLSQLQTNLQEEYTFEEVQTQSQTVYNWLIQPVRKQLDDQGIKTLVFVLDGPLRMIPMAALYDGEHYLVEKFATSLVLGLEVRDPEPLRRQTLKVLAASLTDPPEGFENTFGRLENVNPEVDKIKEEGVPVTFIRDREFTQAKLTQTINSSDFQVVHLATHGQFGSSRESTYLLAADGAIYVDNLSNVFHTRGQSRSQAIELLILSACKTATGNDRAVLGIAGTTVRAGARSAIAGLWSLADAPSVRFTQELYKYLGEPSITRAEALRRAQLALLQNPEVDYSHPRYWAPYVLVGSWL